MIDRELLLQLGGIKACNFHKTDHQDFALILGSFINISIPAKVPG